MDQFPVVLELLSIVIPNMTHGCYSIFPWHDDYGKYNSNCEVPSRVLNIAAILDITLQEGFTQLPHLVLNPRTLSLSPSPKQN